MDFAKTVREERDKALLALDTEWAMNQLKLSSEKVALIAMHKARLELITLPTEARQESLDWLRERNYKRTFGTPLPDTLEDME